MHFLFYLFTYIQPIRDILFLLSYVSFALYIYIYTVYIFFSLLLTLILFSYVARGGHYKGESLYEEGGEDAFGALLKNYLFRVFLWQRCLGKIGS